MIHGAAEVAAAPFTQPLQTVVAAAVEMVGGAPARRCWRGTDRCWIEVRGLQGDDGRRIGSAVMRGLRDRPGVHRAYLNYPLSRVVIELDGTDPEGTDLARLCAVVADAESRAPAPTSRSRPTDLPGDGILLALKGIAAAVSGVGIGAAAVGRTLMLPKLPAGVMALVSAIDYQPKIRAVLEDRLGPQGADAVLSVGAATVYALTSGACGGHRGVRASPFPTRRGCCGGQRLARTGAAAGGRRRMRHRDIRVPAAACPARRRGRAVCRTLWAGTGDGGGLGGRADPGCRCRRHSRGGDRAEGGAQLPRGLRQHAGARSGRPTGRGSVAARRVASPRPC